MKKIMFAAGLCLFAFSGSVYAQTATPPPASQPAKDPFAGKVKFKEEMVSFGTTKFNQPVTVEFAFTNISNQPLLVENVQASCGCTNPTWPRQPILPNQTDTIKATFSANTIGKINKIVWVRFQGINDDLELHLLGTVTN